MAEEGKYDFSDSDDEVEEETGHVVVAAAAAAAVPLIDRDDYEEAVELNYSIYRPTTDLNDEQCQDHPDTVVESGALGTTAPPRVTYKHSLPVETVRNGGISGLQLESVVFAGQVHQRFNMDGSRKGFLLGDGAGVGKGRQIAAIIYDNWMKGRRRSVWISTGADLKVDAERDMSDIGADIPIHLHSEVTTKEDIDIDEGVLFTTYTTLGNSNQIRLDQIVHWLQRDFDGPLMLDESHKAKNLENETKAARAIFDLQERLPHARVVYCSATAVSEPSNLAYMTRMGLWGPGTCFDAPDDGDSFKLWKQSISACGIGTMELTALHLKAEGALMCRTLSYDNAQFSLDRVDVDVAVYDAAVELWQDILAEYKKAVTDESLDVTKQPKVTLYDKNGITIKGATASTLGLWLWGQHQNFFKSLCIAMKVDRAVELAQEAVRDGMCAVIGLQSTGDSRTSSAVAADETTDDFISAPHEILKTVIFRLFWYKGAEYPRHETHVAKRQDAKSQKSRASYDSDDEPIRTRLRARVARPQVYDSDSSDEEASDVDRDDTAADADDHEPDAAAADEGSDVEDADVIDIPDTDESGGESDGESDRGDAGFKVARLSLLMEKALALKLPGNPLDIILDRLGGPDKVAELTGRTQRLVRSSDGTLHIEKRNSNTTAMKNRNMVEKKAFQDGEKLYAILSDAASVGISLQADRRVPNQRRRVHITLELPWAADRAVQQMGRTHRSNQASAPIYRLLISSVGGEMRFACAVAKRLQTMGAIMSGSRRAGHQGSSSLGFDSFNVDSSHGKEALRLLYEALENPMITLPIEEPALTDEDRAGIDDDILERIMMKRRRIFGYGAGVAKVANVTFREMAASWLARAGLDVEDMMGRDAKNRTDVTKFLNRMLGMKVAHQRTLFDIFSELLEYKIDLAKREGKYESGITTITGIAVKKGAVTPLDIKHPGFNPGDVKLVEVNVDRSFTWDAVKKIADGIAKDTESEAVQEHMRHQHRRLLTGFFHWKSQTPDGRDRVIFCVDPIGTLGSHAAAVGASSSITVYRAHRGKVTLTRTKVIEDYTPIDDIDFIERTWSAELNAPATYVDAKGKTKANLEKRNFTYHMLIGRVVPLYPILDGALRSHGAYGDNGVLRVVLVKEMCNWPVIVTGLKLPDFHEHTHKGNWLSRFVKAVQGDDVSRYITKSNKRKADTKAKRGKRKIMREA